MKALGLFIASLISIPLSGFTVSALWGWFLVPLGVPAIGIAHGCGISLIVGYLKGTESEPESTGELPLVAAKALLNPPMYLAVGYLVHLVMGL